MDLSELKQEVESKGWAIDDLIIDLDPEEEDFWIEYEWGFNDTQKSLLCLALLGHSPATAAGKLGIKTRTHSNYCSKGLFKALSKLYAKSPRRNAYIPKINWNNIQIVCEEMGYLQDLYQDLDSEWRKFCNYFKNGDIILSEAKVTNNQNVKYLFKKLFPNARIIDK